MASVLTEPIFLPPKVHNFLDNVLFTPESYFHPEFAPQPRIIGVYGREGLKKASVIEEHLKGRGLSVWKITCQTSKTGNALLELLARQKADSEFPDIQSVVIIEHADTFLYDAESREVTMDIFDVFESYLKNTKGRIICVFDRLPGYEPKGRGEFAQWYEEHWTRFFKLFDTEVFFQAPHRDFRIAFYKYTIQDFVNHQNSVGKKLDNQLTEEDYEYLANHSQFATQHNMLTFLTKIFYPLIYDQTESPVLNLTVFQDAMYNLHELGGNYIYHQSFHRIEDRFSTALKNGPVVPDLAVIRNAACKSQELPAAAPPVSIASGGGGATKFSEENASETNAKDTIEKTKKKKNKKKRENTPVIPEQEYPDPLAGILGAAPPPPKKEEGDASKRVKITEEN